MNEITPLKPPPIYIRSSQELYALVAVSAARQDRSMNKEAQRLIRLGLECEKTHEHEITMNVRHDSKRG